MTYRDKIQAMIATIETIYDDAGWLRDLATEQEKHEFNRIRSVFYDVAAPLRRIDDALSDGRAAMEI